MTVVSFFVPGEPAPQGSKRHVGHGVMIEANKRTAPWRATVAEHAMHAATRLGPPLAGPIELTVNFTFRRHKAHYGTGRNASELKPSAPLWKTSKPDLDKLVRAVADGIVDGGLIRDDSQIVLLIAEKHYGQPVGVRISLREVPHETAFISTDPAPAEAIELGRQLAAKYDW